MGAVFRLLSKAADRNPYSWNMGFYEYPDGSGYEGRFTKCGSCVQTTGICQHNFFDFTHTKALLHLFLEPKSIILDRQEYVKSIIDIVIISN